MWTRDFFVSTASVIFLQFNAFSILWIILEIWVNYPGSTLSTPLIGGYLVRMCIYYVVLFYQALYFYRSFDESSGGPISELLSGDHSYWFWQYIWLSLIVCSLYLVESLLSWIPAIKSGVMCWNNDIIQAVLNIMHPFSVLYVGKRMHVSQRKVLGYIFFWITLLLWKVYFGYSFITSPVTVPTIEMYDDYVNYPNQSYLRLVVLITVWWLPHYLVFLIDLSIWYSVWSAFVGAFIALMSRMGAVRDTSSLREHFMRAPHAFCQRIMPPSSSIGIMASKSAPSQVDIGGIDTAATTMNMKEAISAILPSPIKKMNMSSNDGG